MALSLGSAILCLHLHFLCSPFSQYLPFGEKQKLQNISEWLSKKSAYVLNLNTTKMHIHQIWGNAWFDIKQPRFSILYRDYRGMENYAFSNNNTYSEKSQLKIK